MRSLLMLLSLAACAAGCATEPEAAAESELGSAVPVETAAPLFIHYGFLQSAPVAPSSNGNARDGARTAKLIVPGADNVIVSNLGATDPAFAEWRAAGGKTAYRLSMVDLVTALPAGDPIADQLAAGHDFVAIDELEPSKSVGVGDGEPKAEAFAALLAKHPGKVVLYANSYNMAGTERNLFRDYTTVLGACREHCRALASQVYLATSEAFIAGAPTKTTCASGRGCFAFLSNAIDVAAPGIASKIVSVIDVRGTNLKATRVDSFCARAEGAGALATEMNVARALRQPGVGTYALTYVANGTAGAAYDEALAAFTDCFVAKAAIFSPR